MSKKYKVQWELTLPQLLMLENFSGMLNTLTDVYLDTTEIIEQVLGREVTLTETAHCFTKILQVGDWDHLSYQRGAEDVALAAERRKTIKVGDKEYYEDELAEALKNIKPL